jgi:hypothetical protein
MRPMRNPGKNRDDSKMSSCFAASEALRHANDPQILLYARKNRVCGPEGGGCREVPYFDWPCIRRWVR